MLTGRMGLTPCFKVTAHKGMPGFFHWEKKKNPEAAPLPYFHCAPPLPPLKKKEGKERQESVWPHFTITEGQVGGPSKILTSDYFLAARLPSISTSWREQRAQWSILPGRHRSAGRCRWNTGANPDPGLQPPPAVTYCSGIFALLHFPHSHPGVGPLPSS